MDRAVGMDIFNGNSDGYNMPLAYRELRGASTGEPFVIHKASQGWDGGPGGWIDWKLVGAINRARQAGFKRVGGYHWLLHGNPEAQADLFARALDMIGGRARVGAFVDYERNDWDQALNPQADDMYRFLARCRAIGVNAFVLPYSAPWYTDGPYGATRLDGHRVGVSPWWAGYVQRGYSAPVEQIIGDVTPNWMPSWDGWNAPPAIRQWTSTGLVAGVPSDCDVTFLPGALVDAMFGIGAPGPAPAPTPPIDPHGVNRYDAITAVLSIDPGHNTDQATGGKVHVWQESLNLCDGKVGPQLAVDGDFGPQTRANTVKFQQLLKIADDGTVGHQTWHTMGGLLTLAGKWIGGPARLDRLPLDHPDRLNLPASHILHPSHHLLQGEHYRAPELFKAPAMTSPVPVAEQQPAPVTPQRSLVLPPNVRKAAAIAERCVVVFVTAFVGVYVMSGLNIHAFTDASLLQKAENAGLAALGALLLSLLGGNIGAKNTPSLLPSSLDPVADPTAADIKSALNEHAGVLISHADSLDVLRGFGEAPPGANPAHALHPLAMAYDVGSHLPPGTTTMTTFPEGATVADAPVRKALGRRPPKNAPAIRFADHLATVPTHPVTDPPPGLSWPMDHNDKVGCCVVAGLDHFRQVVETLLTGGYKPWTDSELLFLYQTQNPGFKSWADAGGPDDNGMDIQTLLEYLVKQGVILGFAKVDHTNLDEVKAATYLDLGLVTGEILTSRNMSEQTWDYHASDPVEGGHCTVSVGFDPLEDQVSWGDLYKMTDAFYQKRVEEAWFIITKAHVDHAGFRAGFDLAGFAAAYKQITGRTFPVPVTPTPTPAPAPGPSPAPTPTPTPSPTPDAGLQAALDAIDGLDSWLAKNAAHKKMTVPAYLAWKLAGDADLR